MRSSILIILTIISMSAIAQGIPKLKDKWTTPITRNTYFYIPYGVYKSDTIIVNNIKFNLVEIHGQIAFIHTIDPKFEINNKRYIGIKLADFWNRDMLKLYTGWGNYAPVGDGWYAGFDFKNLSDSSKVKCVFKYDFNLRF